MLSKSKDNFNHQRAWNSWGKDITENKPYNYWPRGRVEMKNKRAIVYVNHKVINEAFEKWIIDSFKLCATNGIENVRIKCDGSKHYNCYIDREC